MALDTSAARDCLERFDLRRLFLEELGWDALDNHLNVIVDGEQYSLRGIAQKRNVPILEFRSPQLPDYSIRRKIEREVARHVFEHLIIFVDGEQRRQVWQWVARTPGRPAAYREHSYFSGTSAGLLLQKLDGITFTLQEEEGLTLSGVTSRLRDQFDRESVTNRFYEQFRAEHRRFLKAIDGLDIESDREWYASLLLNRLMFVYFIQRKRFLDDDPDYLRNRLNKTRQMRGPGSFHSFYRVFLLRLFHEGLGARKHDSELVELLGEVPYLNGGLFDVHELEREYQDIVIPDEAFERIFDFFDQYNWHLDERPMRDQDEINPDVLGHIFEKYVNQKQMGAYYTQEDITGYISRFSIIPQILESVRGMVPGLLDDTGSAWDIIRGDPDRYIPEAVNMGSALDLPGDVAEGYDDTSARDDWNTEAAPEYGLPGETWRELVLRRKRLFSQREAIAAGKIRDVNQLVHHNLDVEQFVQDLVEIVDEPDTLRAFWLSITGEASGYAPVSPGRPLTVLDPTCGSGAFLFAALNVLKPVYDACLNRMRSFVDDVDSGRLTTQDRLDDFRAILDRAEEHPSQDFFVLKSIILGNLYGVDIMAEAVEIAKLRLFLKLAAQVEPDSRLQNLGVEPLPDIDFNIRCGNSLVGYATYEETQEAVEGKGGRNQLVRMDLFEAMDSIQTRAREVEDLYHGYKRSQIGPDWSDHQFDSAKHLLSERLRTLEHEVNGHLARDFNVDPGNEAAMASWLDTHQPFHWFVEFYGVVSSGGFDVVIGNPPYIAYSSIRDQYSVHNYRTAACGNLYAFVAERSVNLAREGGRIGLIVPVSSVSTDGYSSLRKVLLDSGSLVVSNYNDRPGKLFNGLEHIRLSILLLHKDSATSNTVWSTKYMRWQTAERPWLFPRLSFTEVTDFVREGYIPKIGTATERDIIRKLDLQERQLETYVSAAGTHPIFYTRKLSWFVQVLDFIPQIYDDNGNVRDPSELKVLYFDSSRTRDVLLALLNSSLFYWTLTTNSDMRNLNKREVVSIQLDVDRMSPSQARRLSDLSRSLMTDFKDNSDFLESNYANLGRLRIQAIYPRKSKAIIDEIDRALAEHYGFTDEELDFLLNYDIKYRMGGGSIGR